MSTGFDLIYAIYIYSDISYFRYFFGLVGQGNNNRKKPSSKMLSGLNKKEAYKRASFFPVIAIDPKNLDTDRLSHLCGSNYIHLAVMNSLISSCQEINLYSKIVGIQNIVSDLNFNIKDTFIKGYFKCISWNNIISIDEIKSEACLRIKGYIGAIIKRKVTIKKTSSYEIVSTSFFIFKYFGFANFLVLLPRLLVWFILNFFKII